MKGLPIGTMPGDVRRALKLARIQGVTDGTAGLLAYQTTSQIDFFLLTVSLIYRRFEPTGNALLSFSVPQAVAQAMDEVEKITFTGCDKIECSIYTNPLYEQRIRGAKGRADAVRRGFDGSGPSALFPPGKTVTVNGLRGKTPLPKFLEMIRGFQLEDDQETSVLEVTV
jgi:hypothetical protein